MPINLLSNKPPDPEHFASFADFILTCSTWLIVFLAPVHGTLLGLLFITFINAVTGIWKSYKTHQPIAWLKAWKTFAKIFAYQTGLLCAYVAEATIMPGVPLTRTAAGIFAAYELKSIFKNIAAITGVPDLAERIVALFTPRKPPDA